MSSRALRRLREEKERDELAPPNTIDEEDGDDDGDDSDHSDGGGGGGTNKAFLMMMDDSDSDSESEESDEEEEEEEESEADAKAETEMDNEEAEEEDEEEDIDAILSEFQSTAPTSAVASSSSQPPSGSTPALRTPNASSTLLTNLDPRDLDLDRSMGALLGGGVNLGGAMAEQQQAAAQAQAQRMHPAFRGRNQRGVRAGGLGRGAAPTRKFVFGRPNDLWGRPPSYVGGGLGMDAAAAAAAATATAAPSLKDDWDVPWPYSDSAKSPSPGTAAAPQDQKAPQDAAAPHNNPYADARWHTYLRSDPYAVQCTEYEAVASSGDVNALALFVADNPYHAESALQLSAVLFHTNHREEGMELLRRVLWIYEFGAPSSFLPGGGREGSGSGRGAQPVLMDQGREENEGYFSALFRLMRTSCMVGCVGTSLAVSRYLLSLDPLRDPMGVLLTMDYFALASMKDEHARFVVDLVESRTIQIHHRGDINTYCCELDDLPNWAFDYALALYRLKDAEEEERGEDSEMTVSERADAALRSALSKFPSVLELLLDKNDVDTRGRSFKIDWPAVLAHFRTLSAAVGASRDGDGADADSLHLRAATRAAGDHVVKIFVQRSHKLWAGDDVIRWLHENCAAMVTEASGKKDEANGDCPPPFQQALIRYMRCDPADYEDSFSTLPADANPLDEALVAPAMALNPNRRRMLRRGPRGGRGGNENEDWQRMIMEQLGRAPGGEMVMIDPDLPLAEVFWRSLMPWAHVEGVPPPNR